MGLNFKKKHISEELLKEKVKNILYGVLIDFFFNFFFLPPYFHFLFRWL